jgi:hypothetical protein
MMAALIGDGYICADIRIEPGNDWAGQVKNIYQPGDVIACFAGQRVGLMQKLVHEVLRTQLEATIYIISADQPIKTQAKVAVTGFILVRSAGDHRRLLVARGAARPVTPGLGAQLVTLFLCPCRGGTTVVVEFDFRVTALQIFQTGEQCQKQIQNNLSYWSS